MREVSILNKDTKGMKRCGFVAIAPTDSKSICNIPTILQEESSALISVEIQAGVCTRRLTSSLR